MIWLVCIFISSAAFKMLAISLCRKRELQNHLNIFRCTLCPAQEDTRRSSDSAPNTEKDLGQEVVLLRRQVQLLTEECAALRRKNANLEQVLAYIREVVFSTTAS